VTGRTTPARPRLLWPVKGGRRGSYRRSAWDRRPAGHGWSGSSMYPRGFLDLAPAPAVPVAGKTRKAQPRSRRRATTAPPSIRAGARNACKREGGRPASGRGYVPRPLWASCVRPIGDPGPSPPRPLGGRSPDGPRLRPLAIWGRRRYGGRVSGWACGLRGPAASARDSPPTPTDPRYRLGRRSIELRPPPTTDAARGPPRMAAKARAVEPEDLQPARPS